jgi:histidinol-phosphate/aromatic aminotransferase/cobyric acid decarboxylase-like protein
MTTEAPWFSDWAFPLTTALPALATVFPATAGPALAGALGCEPDCLALGAGMAELVLAVRLTTLASLQRVILPIQHPWSRFFRGAPTVPYRTSGTVDVAALISQAREHEAEAIVLGLPDPLTGGALVPAELELLIEATDALLIIDGTYLEFMSYGLVDVAANHDRVLLIRPLTLLTQAAPVACVVGSPAMLAPVSDALAPLPPLLQSSVHAWLAQTERWQGCIADVVEARQALHRILMQTPGVRVLPSQANFICLQGGFDLKPAVAAAGLPVKELGLDGPLADCWQIGIVQPALAMALHETLLRQLLQGQMAASESPVAVAAAGAA